MKRELRNEWTARLRSGHWMQAHGVLNDGAGFCCLGVLCEIGVERGLVTSYGLGGRAYTTVDHNDGSEVMLPDVWKRELGLDESIEIDKIPEVEYDEGEVPDWDDNLDLANVLAAMNDQGVTFDQIADVIEKIVPVED